MLYISRFVGEQGIMIADSDDDSESVVDYRGLIEASSLGIDISGLSVDKQKRSQGVGNWVTQLDIWSGLSVKSTYAAKLATIRGIDVRVYKDCIAAIRWRSDRLKFAVELKLSDFGHEVGDKLIGDLGVGIGPRPQLVLVFDDSLEFGYHIFQAPSYSSVMNNLSGVTLDIRQMKDESKVSRIYTQLRKDPAFYRADGSSLVLDDVERQMMYRGYR